MRKEYIFNKEFCLKCLPDAFKPEVLKEKLIEDLLSRGYIPAQVQFQKVRRYRADRVKPDKYDIAFCIASYAGKRKARTIYKTMPQLSDRLGDTYKKQSNI